MTNQDTPNAELIATLENTLAALDPADALVYTEAVQDTIEELANPLGLTAADAETLQLARDLALQLAELSVPEGATLDGPDHAYGPVTQTPHPRDHRVIMELQTAWDLIAGRWEGHVVMAEFRWDLTAGGQEAIERGKAVADICDAIRAAENANMPTSDLVATYEELVDAIHAADRAARAEAEATPAATPATDESE